jgi:KUP system potassium uptake protein
VIASQAVISGAFSVTRQAVQLGFLPRVTITHTSQREVGQVYAPGINGILFVGVVALVVAFGSSAALASAYGIAVTGTLAIDTLLFFVVVRYLWHKPLWIVLGGAAAFLFVDLAFFTANLPKVLHGGWFPLGIAVVVFTLLTTWQKGRQIVTERRVEEEGSLRDFVEEVREMEPFRPRRTAIFLSPGKDTTPLALRANFEHNRTLHHAVVIVSVDMQRVPHVPREERIQVDELGYEDDGIVHVSARFGFQDDPNVPKALHQAAEAGVLERDVDLGGCSYFLSKVTIVQSDEKPGMARWREKLFVAMTRTAASPVEYFGLPADRIVTMGAHIEL